MSRAHRRGGVDPSPTLVRSGPSPRRARGIAGLAACLIALAAAPAAATTVIVPDDFATVQQAIDSGANEILIRPGTYDETPVIATIPDNPPDEPEIDDLVIRGLVPAGTSLDSLPVIAGLVFEDLAGFWVHSPSITLADLRFSGVVANRFDTSPYSNPLILGFQHCVLDSGLTDAFHGVGGQLEYELNNCRIDGVVQLAMPQRITITSCYVNRTLVLGAYFGQLNGIEWITLRGNRFSGPGPYGLEVWPYVENLELIDNVFDGFQYPVRDMETSSIEVTGNTFKGPGVCAFSSASWGGGLFQDNSFAGFQTGILWERHDSDGINAAGNYFRSCEIAGIRATGQSISCARNTIVGCGSGMTLTSTGYLAVSGNMVRSCQGDGMVLQAENYALVQSNVVAHCGGDGIRLVDGFLYGNTVCLNGGAGIVVPHSGDLNHNIVYGNGRHGLEYSGIPSSILLGCNDWFGNVAGAISGAEPSATDLALDPLFCDITQDDVHLSAGSPLLNAAGCGPIGALGQGCDAPIVCRLATFTAAPTIEGIEVRWQVADAAPGFVAWLERADAADGPWAKVECERASDGAVTVEHDRTAEPARSYWYRLVATDRGLTRALGEPIRVETAPPTRFALLGTGPNPSPGAVEATFQLPHTAEITLEVFDAQGRRVATLAHGSWPAGIHRANWAGARPASGIYVVRYRHPGGEDLRRVAIVR